MKNNRTIDKKLEISNLFMSNIAFTLTEVLVSLLILTIVIIAYITLFTNAYSDIFSSGHKSNALYDAQLTIEETIAGYDNKGTDSLILPFSSPLTINGKYITVNKTYTDARGSSRTITIVTFVPNK